MKTASGREPLQSSARRPVADDHEPHSRQPGERTEILDLLLGSEATDVADDGLAGGDTGAPGGTAPIRPEALRIDATPPVAQAIDPE